MDLRFFITPGPFLIPIRILTRVLGSLRSGSDQLSHKAQLLKRFGKIALKIFGKVFPFAFLDDVTAKLDNLKIIQVFDSIHSSVPSSGMNGVGIRPDGSIRNVSFDEFR
jgi:hypothetical protein